MTSRQQIREKVVALLKGKTAAGDNVFSNASTPAWHENLPVILIYPRSENVEEYAKAPREMVRDLEMTLEIIGKGEEQVDPDTPCNSLENILDQIAHDVECVLTADETLGNIVNDAMITSLEYDFEAAGETPVGSCRMTLTVNYYRFSPDCVKDNTGEGDLKAIGVDYHVGHHDSPPDLTETEAQDDIDYTE